jgi:hypothetical protein
MSALLFRRVGLGGVVGAADEGAGFDVGEAHGEAGAAEFGELLGRGVAQDRQVLGRGPQVLADGPEIDVLGAQVKTSPASTPIRPLEGVLPAR